TTADLTENGSTAWTRRHVTPASSDRDTSRPENRYTVLVAAGLDTLRPESSVPASSHDAAPSVLWNAPAGVSTSTTPRSAGLAVSPKRNAPPGSSEAQFAGYPSEQVSAGVFVHRSPASLHASTHAGAVEQGVPPCTEHVPNEQVSSPLQKRPSL